MGIPTRVVKRTARNKANKAADRAVDGVFGNESEDRLAENSGGRQRKPGLRSRQHPIASVSHAPCTQHIALQRSAPSESLRAARTQF